MIDRDPRPINLYVNLLVVVLAFSLPLYRHWVTLAAPLAVLLWFFEGRLWERLATLCHEPVARALAAFLVLNLVSLTWSAAPSDGFGYVSKYHYLLLIPALATSMRPRFRRLAENAFLLGAVLAAALSFAVMSDLVHIAGIDRANPAVTMSHLDFSMVLAVAALLALDRAVRDALTWRGRTLLVAGAVWLAACLAGNIGRSGQLAFAVTLPVMAVIWSSSRSRRHALMSAIAAVVLLVVGYAVVPHLHQRVDAAASEVAAAFRSGDYATNQGNRVAGAIVATAIVHERPVLGTGVGANMIEFRRLLDSRFPDLRPAVYWYPHMHNQYLQSVTETGLTGLAAMLWLMLRIARPRDRFTARGVLLALVYLVGFLGDPFLHKQMPLVTLAVLAGLEASRAREDEPDPAVEL